ncbi:serine hydrolase [Croceivirga lutea]|uniref:serine hydrolase domain-containing protein n=1 Tax=Croceivirga lutea TaxID=1775167 RepID=UPI00163AC63E|nr:serine hydrolase domain-containing protein [Croceivirga lutea]GGG37750.1 serine hydrolase [Croceivirga lutea]
MTKTTLFLVFSFSLFFLTPGFSQELPKATPEEVGVSTQRLNFLTQNMEQYVANNQLPGAVVLLARKNKVFYHQTFGFLDKEAKTTMPSNAIFRIASQTKAIVSVAIMILQEEGQLNITDPLSKYIPEFKESTVAVTGENDGYTIEKAKREITLRDLLTHTAGIGYGYGPAAVKWKEAGIQGWYFADKNEPILETIKRMAKLPMDAQPGEKWVYGYNTDILGAVVEVISKQTLATFLKERILKPLEMNDTHFYLPKDKKDRLATVYSYENTALQRAPNPGHMVGQGMYVEGPRKSYSGGAGYLCTAEDYAKFLLMLSNNGTYNDKRILSRKTVELMTTNHHGALKVEEDFGIGFGLGFRTVENLGTRGKLGSVGEYGWGGAYHSTYWVDPKEELVVVYLTNVIPANGLDDHEKLRNLVYQALVD